MLTSIPRRIAMIRSQCTIENIRFSEELGGVMLQTSFLFISPFCSNFSGSFVFVFMDPKDISA